MYENYENRVKNFITNVKIKLYKKPTKKKI